MIKINVILNNINWKKYLKNPNNYIDKKIALVNKKNKLYSKKVLICTLLLSSTLEIKKLNKKFRNKDKSTDILSFPFYKKNKLKNQINKTNEIYLGDIIINLNKINDKNNPIKFKEQLDKLWIHGLVHLFGYKHKKDKDFQIMNKIENKYLKYLS
tara:strand:+ start:1195 stop:1659 length:465 start_codon:yes stop_codon:yes gene_type:complete